MNLYHYCPTEAFHSIISNREIRLTSLSLSNDSMEGQLVKELLCELARKDNLSSSHIDKIKDAASGLDKVLDGLGFCLSEEKDLLSQWRGYANDACGVSIGFSKEYLELLAESYRGGDVSGFSLQQVIYEHNEQEEAIKPTYNKIKEYIDKGAFKPFAHRTILGSKTEEEIERENRETKKFFGRVYMSMLLLMGELFRLKSIAFKEETEWRLISLLVRCAGDKCSFSVSPKKIKPYRSFKLTDFDVNPIEEIVVGPKNDTPKDVLESFLWQNGFEQTKISYSNASYQ
jgi:hypothetical protein